MNDSILLKGLAFYAYHGVFAEENKLGQRYEIDIELIGDFSKAAHSDDLLDSVNYADVYSDIKEIVEKTRFNLIEKLCKTIADQILIKYNLQKVIVKVRKPQAPIGGIMDYVQVEMTEVRK